MRFTQLTVIIVHAIIAAGSVLAQPGITVEPITDDLVQIICTGEYSSSMAAFRGKDGLLLIDTGFAVTVDTLKEYLTSFSDKKVKYIVNTHLHDDHYGGNSKFDSDITIIAHPNFRKGMYSGRYIVEEFPENAYPDITVADSLTLYFNDEEIKIYALPGSHNYDDIIVYLKKAKVALFGDLAYGMKFPSWDGETGNLSRYADVIGRTLELIPEDVTVISGHGRKVTMTEMSQFYKMLTATTEYVRNGLESGKTVKELQDAHRFSEYESFGKGGFYTVSSWISDLYKDLQNPVKKISVVEPLYHAYHKGGVEAVIAAFHDLKENHQDKYQFDPFWNVYIPDYLKLKGEYDDAIRLFHFALDEDPDYEYRYFMFDLLAETYERMSDDKKALESYRESLKLWSDNENTKEKIKKLEKKVG